MASPALRTAQPTPLREALRACRGSLALVFAYSCGCNLLLLAPALYLLQIYDRVLSSRSVDTLLMLTLVVAAAVVVGGLLDALRRAAMSRIGAWLDDRLRSSVLAASFEFAARDNPAQAVEVYRDIATLRQFFESSASMTLLDVPWAPIFLAVLFLVHPLLGVLGLVFVLVLFALALVAELVTRAPIAQLGNAQANSYRRLAAVLNNVHVLRAMDMIEGAARLVSAEAAQARDAQGKLARRTEIIQMIAKPIRSLTQVVLMGAAAWLVLRYQMNAGIIFAASLLFSRGLAPIEGAMNGWKAFSSASEAYRRMNDVFVAVAPSSAVVSITSSRPEGRLTVEDVSYVPPGAKFYALKGISFRLAPGECLGVIGQSGSGKSTLGRLIAGICAPTSGRVLLDSEEICCSPHGSNGRYLGYVPQDVEFFAGAVRDNIARMRSADPEKIIEAAKLVGLHEAILQLPRGYDTDIGEAGGTLRRGQRQRLALARALFGEPRLVVLDEPNASLDYFGEQMLYEAIERMKAARVTVVIITHRTSILTVTNKIAILQGGTLAAFGDRQEIFQTYLRRSQINTNPDQDPPTPDRTGNDTAQQSVPEPSPLPTTRIHEAEGASRSVRGTAP